MEFAFDDDQLDYQKAVGGLLSSELPPSELRKIWSQGHDYEHRLWRKLGETGLPGIIVDEKHGGSGGDIVDLMLALEECGAACLPEPFVETALVAPAFLAKWGGERGAKWLELLAEGNALFAVSEGPEAEIVAEGSTADALLAVIDEEVHLFSRGEWQSRPVAGTDPSRRLAICSFAPTQDSLVSADRAAVEHLLALGAVGTAAALVGASRQMIEMTREHLLTREQFGRKLGSFQALKHRLADAALQTEAARSLVWYAGYALAHTPDESTAAAALAKSAANEAGRTANFASLQLHGGIGFTWEHSLHFWLQRERSWEHAFGTTEFHRMRTGAAALNRKTAA